MKAERNVQILSDTSVCTVTSLTSSDCCKVSAKIDRTRFLWQPRNFTLQYSVSGIRAVYIAQNYKTRKIK